MYNLFSTLGLWWSPEGRQALIASHATNIQVVPKPEPVWPQYKGSFTPSEMVDVLEWIAKRVWNESSSCNLPKHEDRMTGRANDIMIIYLITGIKIDWPLNFEGELTPIMNFYSVAPDWIKEAIEPLVVRWRNDVYKDPDFVDVSV